VPGRVILQSYNSGHYTIESVLRMDYGSFCLNELTSREMLQYPPFSRMLKLLVTAPGEDETRAAAEQLAAICRSVADSLRESNQYVAVLGPSPAPLVKLKRRFRYHIFVKAWTNQALQQFTESVLASAGRNASLRRVQVAVDRDPTMNM
jgi:primosomal protein N' (replication factor Y) (superfamily II helicase)